jgi:hypothetical protein
MRNKSVSELFALVTVEAEEEEKKRLGYLGLAKGLVLHLAWLPPQYWTFFDLFIRGM